MWNKIPTQCQNQKEFCEVFNLAGFYFNTFLLNDENERIFITEVFLW